MLELLFGRVSVPTSVLVVVCVPAWGEYVL